MPSDFVIRELIKRIYELECKVEKLEGVVYKYEEVGGVRDLEVGGVDSGCADVSSVNIRGADKGYSEFDNADNKLSCCRRVDVGNIDSVKRGKKLAYEVVIGRYLIGGLASLFIFVAVVSFGIAIWGNLPAFGQLIYILIAGVITSAVGLYINKKNSVISSILVGTGAGTIFIGLTIDSIHLFVFNDIIRISLLLIWAIGLLYISEKYGKIYPTIFEVIGSLIAIIVMVIKTGDDGFSTYGIITVCVYAVISVVVLLLANRKYKREYRWIICCIVSFSFIIPIMQMTSGNADFVVDKVRFLYIILGYIIIQLINKYGNNKAIGVISAEVLHIVNEYFVYKTFEINFSNESEGNTLVLISTVAVVFNVWVLMKRYNISGIFITVILFSGIFNNVIDVPIGCGIMAIICYILSDIKYNKDRKYAYILAVIGSINIIINEAWLVFGSGSIHIAVVMETLCILVIFGNIIKNNLLKQSNNTVVIKSWVYILSRLMISASVVLIPTSVLDEYTRVCIMVVLDTVITIGLIIGGYFKSWAGGFKLFKGIGSKLEMDNSVYALIMGNIITYTVGLLLIIYARNTVELTYTAILVIITFLMQSSITLHRWRKKYIAGFYIGLKGLILIYSIIFNVVANDSNGLIFSISGILYALICIYLGFKIGIKSIRVYGLIIVIVMTMKSMVIDITGANSYIRVVALILGGILCFGISLIYNKFNASNERKEID